MKSVTIAASNPYQTTRKSFDHILGPTIDKNESCNVLHLCVCICACVDDKCHAKEQWWRVIRILPTKKLLSIHRTYSCECLDVMRPLKCTSQYSNVFYPLCLSYIQRVFTVDVLPQQLLFRK